MRRVLILAALLAVPAAAEAQPRLMVGGGFTTPHGSLSDGIDPGWHAAAGLQIGVPTLPVGLRADGRLHKLSSGDAAFEDPEYLTGALSLVFTLPGVGLEPYFLGGIGSYRFRGGPVGAANPTEFTDTGYHAGFGVALGQLGAGLFAEVRYVFVDQVDGYARLLPLTVGLRL